MNDCSVLLKHFAKGDDKELLKFARCVNEHQVGTFIYLFPRGIQYNSVLQNADTVHSVS